MRNKYFILPGILSFLFICGIGASANSTLSTPIAKDSTETARETPETSVIDEVIWVVGDEPILKSDVEMMRMQSAMEGVKWQGNPDYLIPEQIAVQKLFLHQAALDSIEVNESQLTSMVNQQLERWISQTGSKEKLEEYRGMSISQIRDQLFRNFKNGQLVQMMRQKLVSDITVTPGEVRRFFRNLPEDSIPFVPTQVEVEIITRQPKIKIEEINRVKDELRDFTKRVTNGETTFTTLAHLYSEDPESARQGGEIGYQGRGVLDPDFANVAFNLTDPKKISKIVETEFGFHIIQLIDKRGDKVNVRHILLKPKVSKDEIDEAKVKLDSIADNIRDGKFTFENAATFLSDDKDTRNNKGLMSFTDPMTASLTSRVEMKYLPPEIAREVEKMQPGDISKAFQMQNKKGKTVCAIIKLKERVDGHRATISEDYQVMKNLVLEKQSEQFLHQWIVDKIKHTYVRMKDRYKNGKYQYEGWIR